MVSQLKVVLVGDSGVGKTSIIHRFVKGTFDVQKASTLGASFTSKTITLPRSERKVQLNIWDTAGQERYHSLATLFYKEASIAILVYDITNASSFDGAQRWLAEVQEKTSPNLLIAIVANKYDRILEEAVELEKAQGYAKEHNCLFQSVSAKEGLNIEELFLQVAVASLESTGPPSRTDGQKKPVSLNSMLVFFV